MKKYFALFLFVFGLLLLPPGISQANIAAKEIKLVQERPAKLSCVNRIAVSPEQGKAKVHSSTARHGAIHVSLNRHKNSLSGHKRSRKARKARFAGQGLIYEPTPPPVLAKASGSPGLEELREYYQDWRGTRYRLGGISHAGVDCSGFTTLAFRDVYGIKLPRTAREQAAQGISVDRDSLRPGDLVFFKRGRRGDHVGIYMGNGSFMHASTSQGVMISSIDDGYWRDKFWKGSRLRAF